ncbi:MAG: hypothetical protein SGBAC_012659 [Bacillariaceae sp.]
MSDLNDCISIRVRQRTADDMEYKALTMMDVDILVNNATKIGSIEAWLIHRHKIPTRHYYSAFDGHSRTCQWLGCVLLEPTLGRTKLESLFPYDNDRKGFLIIDDFQINDGYKTKPEYCDIGAIALSKFLKHDLITKKVTSMTYVLHPNFTRAEANIFLRNGFFQDSAIAFEGGEFQRILVASTHHTRLLKSLQEVSGIQLISVEDAQMPQGKNQELFQYLQSSLACVEDDHDPCRHILENVGRFLQEGATVQGSLIMHVAVANNSEPIVRFLLDRVPSAVNAREVNQCTPLMICAKTTAGKSTKSGVRETRVLDLLLTRGADKTLQDRKGMTAYGHYVRQRMEYDTMMSAMMGQGVQTQTVATYSAKHPSERAVQAKLLPPNGPSASDLRGGAMPGLIVYEDEIGAGDSFGDY